MPQSPRPAHPLRVVDVTAGYDTEREPVVEALTLEVGEASLLRLAGANGSGKTTVLELCSGYLRPWSGAVWIHDSHAHSPEARVHRRVCRTQPALYPHMTVAEHLHFASHCFAVPVDQVRKRASAYGLDQWVDHEAKELSTGSARKLWILMCTLGEFSTLVLDEPLNGLDTAAAAVLCDEIDAWRQSAAVMLIAHHLPAGVDPDATVTLPAPPGPPESPETAGHRSEEATARRE